jgi:hypothetical protein
MKRIKPSLLLVCLLLLAILSACNFPAGDATATQGLNSTQAHETVVARVTEVAMQTATVAAGGPTQTPAPVTPSDTPAAGTPSSTPAPTFTPSSTQNTCDVVGPGNPIDVTIPDDTEIVVGATFTKVWRLVNQGTCTWTNQYAVVWDSGDQLGVENVVFLDGSVPPGASVDISVEMKAPTTPGSYQSNWKLRNASGVLFGLSGTGPFWVRIEAVNPTPTPTVTPTRTPTATPTPSIQVSGTRELVVGNTLNLDNLFVNDGDGNDISYVTDINDSHLINPLGGASITVYGASQPGLANCQNAGLGQTGVSVEAQAIGTYLCFQTDQGRYGWLQISALDPDTGALTLNIVTWQAGP